MKSKNVPELELEHGSGNVFRDLGIRNPEIALLKAEVAIEIRSAIERKGITQREAAEILGVQPIKMSHIVCGRLNGYTLDRLFTYLNKLDVDVQVRMKQKPNRKRVAGITTLHAR